jgi:protein subunit release factor A
MYCVGRSWGAGRVAGRRAHAARPSGRGRGAAQVGTGSRSEKIKTYNFKDSRVSDHRTKVNYDLDRILLGDLEAAIQSLIALDQQEQLAALAAEDGA